MAKQLFLNNFESTFIANVKDAPTTGTPATELGYGILQLNSGAAAALVNPTGGDHYIITAYKRSGSVESNVEIMHVLEVDNTTINECRIRVSRGQEGTPAQAYVPGDYVALRFTKGGADNFLQDGDSRLNGVFEPAFGAGTTDEYLRGDKTWRSFFTDVRAATLTGLSTATNAVITAADTVLGALGKLQKQITDLGTTKFDKTGGQIGGSVEITGTGRRITGPMSSSTPVADRVLLQSSTSNGSTEVTAIPNGTSTRSSFDAINASDATNHGFLSLLALATDMRLWSGKNGSGTVLPLTFYTDNSERMRIAATGEITVASTINASPAHRNAAVNLTGTTLDFTAGTDFYKTISVNTTITLSNTSAGTGLAQAVSLIINHTGGTITFAGATIKWAGGAAPTLTTGRVHQFYFWPDPITNQVLVSVGSYY